MAKLTLTDVANLYGNPTTAANTLNANNASIEAALENTLSRDGTTPNQMNADIDMNGNDVYNVDNLMAQTIVLNGETIVTGNVYNQDSLKIVNNLSDLASPATARTNLGLGDIATHSASEFQPIDAGLTSISALVTSADKVPYTTASDTYAVTTLSAFGRTLIDDADAATSRTTLGLGTVATQNTGTSGANVPLLSGTNTWAGAQTFPGTTINGAAGSGTRVEHFQTSGVDRFVWGLDNGSESGSNAGSNLFLNSYSDAGGFLANIWSINRSTGVMNISNLTLTNALPSASGGTGTTTSTGSGSNVLSTSPVLTTPNLGTPSAATLTNATGLPLSGLSGLAAGMSTFLGTPTSANLAATVTNETGSGSLVFATSPTLVTPALGTPSSGVLTNCTGLPVASVVGATQGASMTVSTGGFVPALTFGGSAVGLTVSAANGNYVRLGCLVFFNIQIILTNKGSSTGAAVVTGLPFTAIPVHNSYVGIPSQISMSGITNIKGSVSAGTSTIALYADGAISITAITDANFTNTTNITMSGTYNMGSF